MESRMLSKLRAWATDILQDFTLEAITIIATTLTAFSKIQLNAFLFFRRDSRISRTVNVEPKMPAATP
jgi:hypothetical protein